ncbi:MAG: site-specific DNA-methyltransferase [Timaviella obliquedivisa GSE-PSE-MK23-08B]|jgi:site-specific DNA-methyltransferase (adenine-specific)|nr:site-specific DNA-methyltransferase [Timaviella obliquedivisa GSE-PSE-MK23-08B]
MSTREQDFEQIALALSSSIRASAPGGILAEGDSLLLLQKIPAHSISLILTDPPYHSTKKQNIYGDTQFEEDQHYLEWIESYSSEWRRVLRPNGSLFCFCDSSMAARLEMLFTKSFNILSHIVWTKPNDPGFDGWKGKMKKEALRQWYPHSERILFAEPAVEGNLHRSPFAKFLRDVRSKAGLSQHELTAMVGAYGKVNHGGAVSNWEAGRNTPSREQYEKICSAIISTGQVDYMPPYEDVTRVFKIDGSKEFTDVWTFPSVRPYKGKHPAEKPLAMLEHAIGATTNLGDIVLDCFSGSGSTALAALNLGRRTIALEIDQKWVKAVAARLEVENMKRNGKELKYQPQENGSSTLVHQLGLFSGVK